MMNRFFASRLACGAAAIVLASRAAAMPAEYAVRWNPARGGPDSALSAAAALGRHVDRVKVYRIDYFDVATAASGSPVIARRRTHADTTQLTLKTRIAEEGSPDTHCALGSAADRKTEVDVTLLAADRTRRATSFSCTLEGPRELAFAPEMHALPKGCVATMRRLRADDVTIEEWSVRGGAQRLVEVSMKGPDDAATLRRFADGVLQPLLAARAVPLADSKTDFVSGCRP